MTHSPTKTSDLDPPKAAREIEATTDRRGNAGRRSRRPHLVSNFTQDIDVVELEGDLISFVSTLNGNHI